MTLARVASVEAGKEFLVYTDGSTPPQKTIIDISVIDGVADAGSSPVMSIIMLRGAGTGSPYVRHSAVDVMAVLYPSVTI